mgnify:CR=1 FL=1
MPPTRPISDLTAHIGYWLRMVSNHISAAFAAKLADKGVTVAEWCVMRALYDTDAIPPSHLAQGMGLTRGAITKLADRLIAKSLILRQANAQDGRAQTLTLTDMGRALVPDLAADAEFFDALTPEERETLMRLLKSLTQRSQITAIPIE